MQILLPPLSPTKPSRNHCRIIAINNFDQTCFSCKDLHRHRLPRSRWTMKQMQLGVFGWNIPSSHLSDACCTLLLIRFIRGSQNTWLCAEDFGNQFWHPKIEADHSRNQKEHEGTRAPCNFGQDTNQGSLGLRRCKVVPSQVKSQPRSSVRFPCFQTKLGKRNKPKEYPQQPETKTVAKHAMSEVCLLPRPSYSRGRAYKAQSQHKHFMKNRFSKSVRNTVAKISEARAKVFSQRTAVRLTLHFIYLTYIIHISYVLYITYIFYTVFYTIFSRSTSTSTPSSSLSPSSSSSPSLSLSSSSSPTSVSPTLSTPPTHVPSTSSI